MKAEFQNTRGASTVAKKLAALTKSWSPNVALPMPISTERLVAPTIIQKNGKIETKAARLSSR
ncbi:hypothetical protein D3C86_2142950 [compost metagenome]